VIQALSDGSRQRNDRLIAVPVGSTAPADARSFPTGTRDGLSRFFELAVLETGKRVEIEGWAGPEEAMAVVRAAIA
jgi:hypothetical protein